MRSAIFCVFACFISVAFCFPDGRAGGGGGDRSGGNAGGQQQFATIPPASGGGNFHAGGGANDHQIAAGGNDHVDDHSQSVQVVHQQPAQRVQTTVVVHENDRPTFQNRPHVYTNDDQSRFQGNTKFINDYHQHPERYQVVSVPQRSYGDWRNQWQQAHLTNQDIAQLQAQSDWYGQWQYLHSEDASNAEWQAYLQSYGLTQAQIDYADELAAENDQADLDSYLLSLNLDYSVSTSVLGGVAQIVGAVLGK